MRSWTEPPLVILRAVVGDRPAASAKDAQTAEAHLNSVSASASFRALLSNQPQDALLCVVKASSEDCVRRWRPFRLANVRMMGALCLLKVLRRVEASSFA